MTQQFHSEVYTPNLKTGVQTETCTVMFIVALFTMAKMWKQPNIHQLMTDKQNVMYPCSEVSVGH